MNAVTDLPRSEIAEIEDSTAQAEKALAGFSSDPAGPRKPAAAQSTAEILKAMGFGPNPVFASLGTAAPVAGSPKVDPTLEPFPLLSSVEILRQELAAAWNQDSIDDAAFEKVKDFEVVEPGSADHPLLIADHVSQDLITVGTDPKGIQSVLGDSNITAAQALSRALVAATSEQFKTVGITEVHGTDKDKVLLCLAANFVGLKIQFPPLNIDPAVLEEAKKEWEVLMATDRTAPTSLDLENATVVVPAPVEVAEATTAESVSVAVTLEDKIRNAVPDVTPTEVQDLVATLTPDADEPQEPAWVDTVVEEHVDAGSEQDTPTDSPQERAFADTIPVLTEAVGDPATVMEATTADEKALVLEMQIKHLKPEVKAILAGNGPNDSINPKHYVELRERIKAGDEKLSDPEGFVQKGEITKAFQESGIGAGRTARMVKALEADHVVYKTTRETRDTYRMTVNPHVHSPVLHPLRVMPS